LGNGVIVKTTYQKKQAHDPSMARAGSVTVNRYDRSGLTWEMKNTRIGTPCPSGCLCANTGATADKVGDVRACVKQSNVKMMSVIAGIKKDGDQFSLAPTTQLMVLESSLGSMGHGLPFWVEPGKKKTAQEMIQTQKDNAAFLQTVLRVLGPLILWLGIYCCLSPIIYFIDMIGDSLDSIPCVGDFLGGMAECIESLATCFVCLVSCCGALMCSMFVIAIAWLRFRPLIGISCLLVGFLLLGGLIYFASTKKGQGRRRRLTRAETPQVTQHWTQGMEMTTPQQPPVVYPGGQQQMQVTCPAGCAAGSQIQIQAPTGQMVVVTVPAGVTEGQVFTAAIAV